MIARAFPRAVLLLAAGLLVPACSGVRPQPTAEPGWRQDGIASWYGPGFHGRRTANGEVYDMEAMTAAHKELPFDTLVEVHNRDNGQRVRVRINDRGPFVRGRIIDLSRAAAREIGMIGPGTARVRVRVVNGPHSSEAGSGRAYRVQLGAFREAHRAEALLQRARRVDGKARLRFDGEFHRVEVGPFKKRNAAEESRRRFRRRGFEAIVMAGKA